MAEHEQINFDDELRRYALADPFVPSEIVVASGDRYEVKQPLQLALGGDMIAVLLPKTGLRFFRTYQVVAVHVRETAT